MLLACFIDVLCSQRLIYLTKDIFNMRSSNIFTMRLKQRWGRNRFGDFILRIGDYFVMKHGDNQTTPHSHTQFATFSEEMEKTCPNFFQSLLLAILNISVATTWTK